MPLYEYQCNNPGCREVTETIRPLGHQWIACPVCGCLADRIMSAPYFRITGASARNGYSSTPTYDEVIDEYGYAKKRWGK